MNRRGFFGLLAAALAAPVAAVLPAAGVGRRLRFPTRLFAPAADRFGLETWTQPDARSLSAQDVAAWRRFVAPGRSMQVGALDAGEDVRTGGLLADEHDVPDRCVDESVAIGADQPRVLAKNDPRGIGDGGGAGLTVADGQLGEPLAQQQADQKVQGDAPGGQSIDGRAYCSKLFLIHPALSPVGPGNPTGDAESAAGSTARDPAAGEGAPLSANPMSIWP